MYDMMIKLCPIKGYLEKGKLSIFYIGKKLIAIGKF